MAELDNYVVMPVEDMNPAVYNPRQISDEEFEKLKKSINEYGLVQPIVWNKRSGNVVGGHQRLKACKELGMSHVPTFVVDWDDTKEKAANLAMNKIEGEFVPSMLKDLIEELDTGEFDMDLTGFGEEEIEQLMTQFHVDEEAFAEDFKEMDEDSIQTEHKCPACGFEWS